MRDTESESGGSQLARKKGCTSEHAPEKIGSHIFASVTQQEIESLLDAFFELSSADFLDQVLSTLSPDSRQTLKQILSPRESAASTKIPKETPVSLAKLEEQWAKLWGAWAEVVEEAAQEDGEYMEQEEHWEPPYFDNTAFIDDLEKVAEKMLPLLETAFENEFTPDTDVAEAIQEAYEDIASAMPEWMELQEGLSLKKHLTGCLLTWRWLRTASEKEDAFDFAQDLREWEKECPEISLDDDTFFDFFTHLSQADQQLILTGFTEQKEASLWKSCLEHTHSSWHALYMHYIDQYEPHRYLDTLRLTVSQQWQNGLPVIKDLLEKKAYHESLVVIQETCDSLLRDSSGKQPWTPEKSLLFVIINRFHYSLERWDDYKMLLDFYQQTAQGLNQPQRMNVMKVQRMTFDECFNWQAMFKAFEEIALPQETRQALFQSWKDYILHITQPHRSYEWGFRAEKTEKSWWLQWLIESIVVTPKGPSWFQKEITQWLAHLPPKQASSPEDFDVLRLLTNDLQERPGKTDTAYPHFFRVVIRPGELKHSDDASRQTYVKQHAPTDLLERVMVYWNAHLQYWVPNPQMASKSDYTSHAQWMAALKELAPGVYATVLEKWRVEHKNRRNLWHAMSHMG